MSESVCQKSYTREGEKTAWTELCRTEYFVCGKRRSSYGDGGVIAITMSHKRNVTALLRNSTFMIKALATSWGICYD